MVWVSVGQKSTIRMWKPPDLMKVWWWFAGSDVSGLGQILELRQTHFLTYVCHGLSMNLLFHWMKTTHSLFTNENILLLDVYFGKSPCTNFPFFNIIQDAISQLGLEAVSRKENYPWWGLGFLDTHHFHFLKWPFPHPHFSNYFSPFILLRKQKYIFLLLH